jgi:hypothetical protein
MTNQAFNSKYAGIVTQLRGVLKSQFNPKQQ